MYHRVTTSLLTTLHLVRLAVRCGVLLRPTPTNSIRNSPANRAHTFIAGLQNDKYIDSKPMHVEGNSVNAFRPTYGSDLTAFGFRVYAILGYQRDDGMFKVGEGEALAGSLYGAVVIGPTESAGMGVQGQKITKLNQ
jgi:hypothetical protein